MGDINLRVDGDTVQKGGMYARHAPGVVNMAPLGPMSPQAARDLAEVLVASAFLAEPGGDAEYWRRRYEEETWRRHEVTIDVLSILIPLLQLPADKPLPDSFRQLAQRTYARYSLDEFEAQAKARAEAPPPVPPASNAPASSRESVRATFTADLSAGGARAVDIESYDGVTGGELSRGGRG